MKIENKKIYDRAFRPLNAAETKLFEQQKKRRGVFNKQIIDRVCSTLLQVDAYELTVAYSTSRCGDWTYAVVQHVKSGRVRLLKDYPYERTIYVGAAKRTTYGDRADEPSTETGWRVAFSRAIETPPVLMP